MATKKAALKKPAAKSAKNAKPAAKAPAKKTAVSKNLKPAPKATAKKVPAKPAPKTASTAKKTELLKKAVPTPAKKASTKPASVKSAPSKKEAQAPPVGIKKVASVKTPAKSETKAAPTVKKTEETVQKPVVAAKTQQEIKPAIKPLAKPAPTKKEPAKPLVIPKTSTTKAVKYEPEFTKSVLDARQQQQQAGPSMRYSDADLSEFRDLINRKLDTAKKELAYLQGLITRKDEGGNLDEGRYMTMEDGSMSMEREQLSQMASRQIQFIDHLEKAIMRIENKTYGICRVTGKLIDKARLRAVPHATLSIEAKQMMNK
jgi:RNA polymerase-binding transcription factor DksA